MSEWGHDRTSKLPPIVPIQGRVSTAVWAVFTIRVAADDNKTFAVAAWAHVIRSIPVFVLNLIVALVTQAGVKKLERFQPTTKRPAQPTKSILSRVRAAIEFRRLVVIGVAATKSRFRASFRRRQIGTTISIGVLLPANSFDGFCACHNAPPFALRPRSKGRATDGTHATITLNENMPPPTWRFANYRLE